VEADVGGVVEQGGGVYHRSLNKVQYYKMVNRAMQNAEDGGQPDIILALRDIALQLTTGVLEIVE
jgi:hypothetical protein